jgi:16S rRNA processing protein RimM
MEGYLEIGELVREHGVKGEVKVLVYSGSGESLRKGLSVILQHKLSKEQTETIIESVRPVHDGFLIRFKLFDSPEAAKLFRRAGLLLKKTDLPQLASSDHYIEELFGFSFYDLKGNLLGELQKVTGTGKTLLFSLINAEGQEILIPLVSEWIKKIDKQKKQVTCDLPEGLVEIQMAEKKESL